jgi:hypothetical protein
MRLILVSVVITLLLNCSGKKHNFYVHNKDTQAIDSLRILVGDETYLIEYLQPRTTKGIKIYKLGGKQISFQADDGKLMPLSSIQKPPFRGTLRFIITKERILSTRTSSN